MPEAPPMSLTAIAALERACLTALPAPRHAWDGPFVLKAFLGGTGRANACCALDPAPDPDLAARIGRIEATYHRLGLPSRFRSTPLDPPGLAEALLARGYLPDKDPTIVHAGPLVPVARPDAEVRDEGGPSEAWMALVATAEHQTPARRAEKLRNKDLLAAPGAWLVLREEGVDAACLFAVADGAHCGIFDLATRPDFRRRGLGARLIRAAAQWARGLGAEALYAQVASGNRPSRALQESLGLREAYRYSYYVKPTGG
ncbi:GNAT family N-acetyltransferase [Roseicella aerolata]|uniref:GNAT family N-acetyltransferase n=1 Tax=Roseicella aerolata TaxID=2883479 RepID=A0A9X1L8Q1_9PROT|nr:GNAT family N-acetyltransferase [Roseicella aerolata]MCB4823331.1 GNAT family N-acetyltransferase [Roseicella aerolata]